MEQSSDPAGRESTGDALFPGFERRTIDTSGASINIRCGGEGPPLLLLHGYPETQAMWHRVAPRLAREFTVVAADLRGYGDGSKPDGGEGHEAYSKRAMARDQLEVMGSLGFDSFAVAGHDRGARVAYRMALDHPEAVRQLAVMDILPTHWVYSNVNRLLATAYYHWFMLIQPYDLPERLIGADPEYYLRWSLDHWSGSGLGAFDDRAVAEYVRCFSEPAAVHATCEDYRAGASIDFELDASDLGTRKIACPTLVLTGRGLGRLGAVDIWKEWAEDVRGSSLSCGHFLPEEAPDETHDALHEFFAAGARVPGGGATRGSHAGG